MKLSHIWLSEPIKFNENIVNVLVVESPHVYRSLINDLILQESGFAGDFVLSCKNETIEFYKKAAVISDVFRLDFDSRKISSKLNNYICGIYEMDDNIRELFNDINDLGYKILEKLQFEADFNHFENVEDIIKVFDFKLISNENGLAESLFEYVKIQKEFFGKELCIIVGLRSCLERDELEAFYKRLEYEKLNVLLLESHQTNEFLDCENVLIIDKDLCEIR